LRLKRLQSKNSILLEASSRKERAQMAKWSIKELFWRSAEVDGGIEPAEPVSAVERTVGVDGVLRTLRDVQGVVGSVAIGVDGAVWGRDLPTTFDEESTSRLAQRLAQLYEALTSEGDQFDAAALRYQGYRFHISRALPGLLGVLTQEQVNLPALSMAMKLAGRKIATHDARGAQ
jgi:predicted regulator of Ras-like GTPase activity (Roadblock/LC7/MglB family)